MLVVLSIVILLHGLAHLPGFLVSWRLMHPADLPYTTMILGNSINVGDAGIRFVGVLWLIVGLGCVAAGIAGIRGMPGWHLLALSAVTLSSFLCIVGWPAARIGLAVDLTLLAIVAGGMWFGWLPPRAA